MWQGLLTIMDLKNKSSHVVDTNSALLDELNTFFSHFEQNNPELPRRAPVDNRSYLFTVSMEWHM
jgi:hypothetical protein